MMDRKSIAIALIFAIPALYGLATSFLDKFPSNTNTQANTSTPTTKPIPTATTSPTQAQLSPSNTLIFPTKPKLIRSTEDFNEREINDN